jgi:hypothetical protein
VLTLLAGISRAAAVEGEPAAIVTRADYERHARAILHGAARLDAGEKTHRGSGGLLAGPTLVGGEWAVGVRWGAWAVQRLRERLWAPELRRQQACMSRARVQGKPTRFPGERCSVVRTSPEHTVPPAQYQASTNGHNEEDFDDLLQELRILLQGAQLLTAFLIFLPFNDGFARIDQAEKWVYAATFFCSVTSLVLFSAPAAQHRLAWPLLDRVGFKKFATQMTIVGMIPLSLALVLATQLVMSEALGQLLALVIAALTALLIGLMWWCLPLAHRRHLRS